MKSDFSLGAHIHSIADDAQIQLTLQSRPLSPKTRLMRHLLRSFEFTESSVCPLYLLPWLKAQPTLNLNPRRYPCPCSLTFLPLTFNPTSLAHNSRFNPINLFYSNCSINVGYWYWCILNASHSLFYTSTVQLPKN